jgi:hypothetical protein
VGNLDKSGRVREREHAWLDANMRDLEENHAGQWVALQGDELIAVGDKLSDVLAAARSKGVENPLITAIRAKKYQGVQMFRKWR